jgi:hypothetical protein
LSLEEFGHLLLFISHSTKLLSSCVIRKITPMAMPALIAWFTSVFLVILVLV